MRTRLLKVCLTLIATLAVSVLPVFAQGHGRGHGNGRGFEVRDRDFDRDDVRIFRSRNTVIFPRVVGSSHRPPGWDRGRKTGWGDCDVPPGQAKKIGCRGVFFRSERRPNRAPVVIFPVR